MILLLVPVVVRWDDSASYYNLIVLPGTHPPVTSRPHEESLPYLLGNKCQKSNGTESLPWSYSYVPEKQRDGACRVTLQPS